MTFCPQCAGRLAPKVIEDRERLVCQECGFIFYCNPKVAAGALVEKAGQVLLARRGIPPGRGLWCLPSGFVECDESPEEAAVREVKEETGLEVALDGLLGIYTYWDDPRGPGILILYRGHVVGGELSPSHEVTEVAFFSPHSLPTDIAFAGHQRVLAEWRSRDSAGRGQETTTRFILVRHGQTAWNREGRFRGREDLPLDEVGLEQAEAAGQRIAATWSVSAVYTSPLLRARQTAQAIARTLALTPQPLEGLLDLDYGRWQGLSPQEVEERYGDLYAAWLRSPQTVRFPGGERLAQVRERALTAVLELARRHPGETVVLVGHQTVNKALLCAVLTSAHAGPGWGQAQGHVSMSTCHLGLDDSLFWRIEQHTGAINVFEYREGAFVVTLLNDTCHLHQCAPTGDPPLLEER